jgi:hypothetical protein
MNTLHVPRRIATHTLVACAMTLCLQATHTAHAAPAKQEASSNPARPAKKSRSVKIKHQQNHSGESSAERDRRLYRECQGLPNAGACLGYTRR